jgi:hypothetical protein
MMFPQQNTAIVTSCYSKNDSVLAFLNTMALQDIHKNTIHANDAIGITSDVGNGYICFSAYNVLYYNRRIYSS